MHDGKKFDQHYSASWSALPPQPEGASKPTTTRTPTHTKRNTCAPSLPNRKNCYLGAIWRLNKLARELYETRHQDYILNEGGNDIRGGKDASASKYMIECFSLLLTNNQISGVAEYAAFIAYISHESRKTDRQTKRHTDRQTHKSEASPLLHHIAKTMLHLIVNINDLRHEGARVAADLKR